ncbi:MAG: hypothetical protein ACHQC8_03030 [Solirubrobacterales bacterium]
MRSHARFALLAPLIGAILAVSVPAAAQAAAEVPIVEKLVAANCTVSTCGQENVLGPFNEPKAEVSKEEAEKEGFTQAGGRVPFGVTDFQVFTVPGTKYPDKVPTSLVTHLRTDVAPGLATNPFAVPRCSLAELGKEITGTPFFTAPGSECEKSVIGKNAVTVWLGPEANQDAPLSGSVYDLVPGEGEKVANGSGLSSLYGVALEIEQPLAEALSKGAIKATVFVHTLIKGNVEWGKEARGTGQGDYHDYFEIEVSPKLPLIRSRLTFEGTLGKEDKTGEGDFITNPTSCPGHNTTTLKMTDLEGKEAPVKTFTTPIGLSGCGSLLFEPAFALASGSTLSDQPNELTTEASVPNAPKANAQSQVKTASVTLPEGMTLNPSAANGLQACTVAQARIHSEVFGSECPAGSEIGTVSLEVPTLPAGSLTGNMYLGGPVTGPETGPITGPPYIVYVVANSKKYGISVRLKGEVVPNEATGRVTTIFQENPEQPFTNLSLHFNRGVLTPLANPLICGEPKGTTSFVPVANPTTSLEKSFGASVTGCPSPLPFSLSQSIFNQPPGYAGAKTSYTLNIGREDGQQYLSQIKTVLPAGLVGLIPTVTQCPEPQAGKGECSGASQIGTVNVSAGAGSRPYGFRGSVYLTGPYGGAPFGLSVVVGAVAGPFNLGNVVTRGTLNVEPYTARVVATSNLPTIVKGIPLRLKGISVEINKQGFLMNPTNCGVLATETTLTSTLGATQSLSSPFGVNNCSALALKPSFKAATEAKTSKANGASLETTLNQGAGQTNIKSVLVQLPKQLPSRLTTLQQACPEATFAVNPYTCPGGSFVGGVRANTPTLSAKLKGPAILVSHGGRAFPDLDLLLEAEGVRVILVGHTEIKNGITTTEFATTPDVPVSSITVNLPIGGHSALAANGNLCTNPLVMPTTITGQNGFQVKQNTKMKVKGCGVMIVGRKVIGNTAYITVQTFEAGRISGSGSNLATVYRYLGKAEKTATLKVPLSRRGQSRGRPLRVRLRVGFVPKHRGAHSAAYATVTFR